MYLQARGTSEGMLGVLDWFMQGVVPKCTAVSVSHGDLLRMLASAQRYVLFLMAFASHNCASVTPLPQSHMCQGYVRSCGVHYMRRQACPACLLAVVLSAPYWSGLAAPSQAATIRSAQIDVAWLLLWHVRPVAGAGVILPCHTLPHPVTN